MSKKRLVAKFGGTSMADADAMRQAASVARDNSAAIVVVSATSGTTDRLIEIARGSINDSFSTVQEIINDIAERHMVIASELEVSQDVVNAQENLLEMLAAQARVISHQPELAAKDLDEMMSFGELLSSNLMVSAMNEYAGLPAELLDARDVIATNSNYGFADPEITQTRENADTYAPRLENTAFVTQGFIGRDAAGLTTTLGRGGSDYSALLFAEAFNASAAQIWTDVAGISTADPRLVSAARPILAMSFQEAAELATAGAKVLYPPTMIPARRANIPVFVGNTFEPEAGGTTIDVSAQEQPVVRAVTLKTDQHLITLNTPKMSQQPGFLAQVFAIIAGHNVSIDQVTTSEVAVAITVDDATMLHSKLFEQLRACGELTLEDDLSVVTLIGNRVNHTPGLMQQVFRSLQLPDSPMSVRAVFQGASKHSIGIIVSAEHGATAVERLHKEFIEGAS